MDKKAVFILSGFLAVVGVGVLVAFMTVLKPADQRETSSAAGGNFQFPATQRSAAVPEEPETGDESEESAMPGGSSLGFVQKDKNIVGGVGGPGGPGGSSGDASQAAAKGDAAGLMSELRKGGGGDVPEMDTGAKRMSSSTTRDLMQRVVDIVHKAQPAWYREFLGHKDLKAVADRYDQSQDFKGFVKGLYKSQAFHGMMKKYARSKQMRTLTKTLLGEQPTGSQLSQLFLENAKDPNMLKMVSSYGKDAGLPAEICEHAENLAPGSDEAAEDAPPARKAAPRLSTNSGGNRPQLRQVGFQGGNFSTGGRAKGNTPSEAEKSLQNIDPQALEQYKKYLKK